MTTLNLDRTSAFSAHRWLPPLTLSTLITAILLITMGSIVRTTDSGLGCPDWPLCSGGVVPPPQVSAWLEFTHRLLTIVTGAQIILLAVLAWHGYRSQRWVFRPALAALGLLVVQSGLGGLHVVLGNPWYTGLLHTAVSMLVVGVVALLVGGNYLPLQPLRERALARSRAFVSWLSLTAAATYLLVLTGSYVTRSQAEDACPSFPLCGPPKNAALADIQMLHRYAAFVVAVLALVLVAWMLTRHREPGLVRFGYAALGLLVVQFGLGAANVLLTQQIVSDVLHLTVAASFWAVLVVSWSVCCVRQPAGE